MSYCICLLGRSAKYQRYVSYLLSRETRFEILLRTNYTGTFSDLALFFQENAGIS
jgi:hypothetical protein